jgi:NADPH-ferrihemoprotein reductase
VQNKLEDQGKEINDLLLHQANFYVCGGSVIARDVQATLVKLISEQRRLSPIEAEETVNAMRSSKQYQV